MDPWHFGTDLDPRIRTTDLWIRKRIRILLFSSVADKMPTENFFLLLITFSGTFTSVFNDKKSKGSHKIVEIRVFLTCYTCWQKDPDPYKIMTDPDPGGLKTCGSGSTRLYGTQKQGFTWSLTRTSWSSTCCRIQGGTRGRHSSRNPSATNICEFVNFQGIWQWGGLSGVFAEIGSS